MLNCTITYQNMNTYIIHHFYASMVDRWFSLSLYVWYITLVGGFSIGSKENPLEFLCSFLCGSFINSSHVYGVKYLYYSSWFIVYLVTTIKSMMVTYSFYHFLICSWDTYESRQLYGKSLCNFILWKRGWTLFWLLWTIMTIVINVRITRFIKRTFSWNFS